MRPALLLALALALAGCGDSRRWEAWRPVSAYAPAGVLENFAIEQECRDFIKGTWFICRPQS